MADTTNPQKPLRTDQLSASRGESQHHPDNRLHVEFKVTSSSGSSFRAGRSQVHAAVAAAAWAAVTSPAQSSLTRVGLVI